ncbi:MAG: mannitol dehydrogenase family protein [Litoreibacter sp.]
MPNIVHLGTGNFHRAHQAWYTHLAGGDWSIIGSSFRSPSIRDTLRAQDFDYTLIEQGTTTNYHRVKVIKDVLFVPEQGDELHAAMIDDDTAIITLTISEKGYGTDGAVATLTRALLQRTAPVTVISCDNLTGNGDNLAALVKQCAGGELPVHVTFPNCMVDRITPATTDTLRADVFKETDFADQAPVATETFTEWVIEDNFAGPRPDWHKAGVQFVSDVAPHELRKLRMLNGAHSYLAYAGVLAGYEFVHQAVGDADLRAGAIGVMEEAARVLLPELDTDAYRDALIARFENPNLHHKLRQIAMDGTQKLPIRLGSTIAALNGDAPNCQAGIDAWVQFVQAETTARRRVDDPKSDAIAAATSEDVLRALL